MIDLKTQTPLGRLIRIGLTTYHRFGLKEFLKAGIRFLFRLERYFIYQLDLESRIEPVECNLDIKIEKVTEDNLKELEHHPDPVPVEFLCRKLDGVKTCFAAYLEDVIVHVSWIYLPKDFNRIVDLKEREAEFKYEYTLPQYRGKKILPKVITVMCEYLKERGFKRVYESILQRNTSSIKAAERVGFKKIASVNYVRLLGLQISKKFRP